MSDPVASDELQAAQEQLYENEALRQHLSDDQATPLLDWAAQRLGAAAGSGVPLEQAQETVSAALRLIDQAAAQNDPAQQQQALSRLPDILKELPGGPPPPLPPMLAQPTSPTLPTAQAAKAHVSAASGPPSPNPSSVISGEQPGAALPEQAVPTSPPPVSQPAPVTAPILPAAGPAIARRTTRRGPKAKSRRRANRALKPGAEDTAR